MHPSAFVHPLAAVTGNVIIGKDVYIGPGAAIRGDWGGAPFEDVMLGFDAAAARIMGVAGSSDAARDPAAKADAARARTTAGR